jgi:prepilin-type N-terminal cleavage/methylation domain-containing protein
MAKAERHTMQEIDKYPRLSRPRSGFTLVELMVAIAIVSILMLAMQSAILLAAKAVPDGKSRGSALVVAARAADTLNADLSFATSILTMTATQVQFTVPDRDGDGAAETITYAWSGTADTPLTRTINTATAVNVVDKVQEFALSYDKRTVALPVTYSESAETAFFSYSGFLNLGSFTVTSTNWPAQCFKPATVSGATGWRITRVKFRAQRNSGSTGQSYVQLRTTNSSGTLPTSTVLMQSLMNEGTLDSNYAWVTFNFTNAPLQPPGGSLALVIQWVSDSEACDIQFQNLLGTVADSNFAKTTNGGTSWTAPSGQDMLFAIYGKYTSPDPVVYQYPLTNVRCALRTGTDASSRINANIRVINEPLVSGP